MAEKLEVKVNQETENFTKKQREFSASMLTTLFGCPLAFYFQYIKHEKVPQSSNLAFGAAIHYMLKLFYERNFKSAESFANFWKGYWMRKVFLPEFDSNGKSVKEKGRIVFQRDKNGKFVLNPEIRWFNSEREPFIYMNLGIGILRNFYMRHKEKPMPFAFEQPFRKVTFRGHLLRGVWDRIDETEEGILITDYKTNKGCPIDERELALLHRHPQFTIYSIAFREVYGKTESGILFYHLRSGKLIKTTRSQEDYDYTSSMLDKAQKIIEDEDYTPFYGFHCKWCDFLDGPCKTTCIGVNAKITSNVIQEKKRLEEFTAWGTEWGEWSEER
ncbi:MAG: PD-(D/E)XK nuclease family protein [Candidatus Pacearchaeota archaeon]